MMVVVVALKKGLLHYIYRAHDRKCKINPPFPYEYTMPCRSQLYLEVLAMPCLKLLSIVMKMK